MTGVREVVVDTNVITDGAQPLFIYEDDVKVPASATKH